MALQTCTEGLSSLLLPSGFLHGVTWGGPKIPFFFFLIYTPLDLRVSLSNERDTCPDRIVLSPLLDYS